MYLYSPSPIRPQSKVYIKNMRACWTRYGLSRIRSERLLALWLAKDLLTWMDDYGRFPACHLNKIRKALHYRYTKDMLADIKQSRSFTLTGRNGQLQYIFCSLWHDYQLEDGEILEGSYCFSDLEAQQAAQASAAKPRANQRAVFYMIDVQKQRVVQDFFLNLETHCPDASNMIIGRFLMHVRKRLEELNPKQPVASFTPGERDSLLATLLTHVLPEYFVKCKQFFRDDFLKHPSKRRFWLRNVFKKEVLLDMLLEECKAVSPILQQRWGMAPATEASPAEAAPAVATPTVASPAVAPSTAAYTAPSPIATSYTVPSSTAAQPTMAPRAVAATFISTASAQPMQSSVHRSVQTMYFQPQSSNSTNGGVPFAYDVDCDEEEEDGSYQF